MLSCYLAPEGSDSGVALQYAPESVSTNLEAVWTESVTAGTDVQSWSYWHTKSTSLSLSDLLLDRKKNEQSVQTELDLLSSYLRPDIKSGKLTPPILFFVMGSRRFGPCFLKDISTTETRWLANGQPATARITLNLVAVPGPDSKASAGGLNNNAQAKLEKIDRPLTDREFGLAAPQALSYLRSAVGGLPPNLQTLIKSNSFKLKTNQDTGKVELIEVNGTKEESRGIIGTFGPSGKFVGDGNLPKKQRQESTNQPRSSKIR